MGRRYSRIHQAARYQKALTNYIKFIDGSADRSPGIGKGKARPTPTTLYVIPFNLSLPSGAFLKTSASTTAWEALESYVASHTKATLGATDAGIKVARYKAARISLKTGASARGTEKTSHITGTPYLSYGGTSQSVPFGKTSSSDTSTESAIFQSIKLAHPASKLTLIPEDLN